MASPISENSENYLTGKVNLMKQKNEMLNSMPKTATPILSIAVIICAIFLITSKPIISIIMITLALLILFEKTVFHFIRIRKMKEYIDVFLMIVVLVIIVMTGRIKSEPVFGECKRMRRFGGTAIYNTGIFQYFNHGITMTSKRICTATDNC